MRRACLLLLLLAPPAFAEMEEAPEDFQIERIPFELETGSLGLFDISPDEWREWEQPADIKLALLEQAGPGVFRSNKVLDASAALPLEPVKFLFAPSHRGPFASWKIEIVDGRGKIIKSDSGSGDFPSSWIWDGREEGFSRVRTGEPYALLFTGADATGKERRERVPFVFSRFEAAEKDGVTVVLSGEDLFGNGPSGKLSDHGKSALASAAARAAAHPGHPLLIDVFSRSVKRGTAQSSDVAAHLAHLLSLDPAEIETGLYVDPHETEEVRIHVLGAKP